MSRPTWIALAAAVLMAGLAARLSQPYPASPTGSAVVSAQRSTLPPVRVLLGAGPRRQWQLRIEGPYLVRPKGDFWVLAQGDRLAEVEVAPSDEGIRLGGQTFKSRRLEVELIESGTLWIDGHRYRGSLELVADGERVRAINVVGLEDYLASVLPSEMPPQYPRAAQQAQLIAARTYALFQQKTYGLGQDYDLTDAVPGQTYLGMEYEEAGRRRTVETDDSRALAGETQGIAILYRGRLFCAYATPVCGGHTARAQSVFLQGAPPLIGVACAGCAEAHNFRWEVEMALDDVERQLALHLASSGKQIGALKAIRVNDPGGGIVPTVELEGHAATHRMPATRLVQFVLGSQLPSAFFAAAIEDDRLRISGRGWGHGVGLCQAGAKTAALQGRDCAQILSQYFPGTEMAAVE